MNKDNKYKFSIICIYRQVSQILRYYDQVVLKNQDVFNKIKYLPISQLYIGRQVPAELKFLHFLIIELTNPFSLPSFYKLQFGPIYYIMSIEYTSILE